MDKKILICDDAAFMRMMLKDIMKRIGYGEVYEAENGKKAIDRKSTRLNSSHTS